MRIRARDLLGSTGVGFGLRGLGLAAGAYVVKRMVDARRMARLAGRVVLITGGSRGLGLLLAREFGQRGCKIAICARDAAELDRARLGLENRGIETFATVCDVSVPEQVDKLITDVLARYGQLDVLVNNAGVIQVGPLHSMDLHDFRHAMAVNFWGTVHTTLAAIDALKRTGDGRLVNICSIGGKIAMPHLLPYDCAKFAVLGFSEGLRAELGAQGISVTTVIPGLMRTGSSASAVFKGDQASEYVWFSTVSREHATTIDARKAARQIVNATARGEREVTLGFQAHLGALAKSLLPGVLVRVLAAFNRAMPSGAGKPTIGLNGRTLAAAANRARFS